MDDREMTRLAAAAAELRPDWHQRSVRAFLAKHFAHRALEDVAIALVVVACDPKTTTPARILEHGPWWLATRRIDATPEVGPGRGVPACAKAGHEHEPAHACRACRADTLVGEP